MTMHRTHLLLKKEQHRALERLARQEGRSVSEVARDLIQSGLEQRQRERFQLQEQRMLALEKARMIRERILNKRDGKPFDFDVNEIINEMREERDDQILGRGD